jgi:hypothetical protein
VKACSIMVAVKHDAAGGLALQVPTCIRVIAMPGPARGSVHVTHNHRR